MGRVDVADFAEDAHPFRGRQAAAACGVLLLLSLLQRGVFSHLPLWGVRPDLLQVVALVLGLLRGKRWGLAFGLAAGLCADFQAGVLVGAHMITTGLGGAAAGWISEKIFRDSLIVPVAVVAGLTFGCQLVYVLIANAFGLGLPWREGLGKVAVFMAAYHGLLAFIIYPLGVRLLGRSPGPDHEAAVRGVKG